MIIYSKNPWSPKNQYLVQLLARQKVGMIIISANKTITKEAQKEVIYFVPLDHNEQFSSLFSKISQIFGSDVLTDYLNKIIDHQRQAKLYDDFIATWPLQHLKQSFKIKH